jgi:hypothetical protein
MYSNLLPIMAADRVRGIRSEATAASAARAARTARPARPGRRAGAARSGGAVRRLVRRTVHP